MASFSPFWSHCICDDQYKNLSVTKNQYNGEVRSPSRKQLTSLTFKVVTNTDTS